MWHTLQHHQISNGEDVQTCDINPKAVSTDELYGCVALASREWKDGLLSSVMRDMSNDTSASMKVRPLPVCITRSLL